MDADGNGAIGLEEFTEHFIKVKKQAAVKFRDKINELEKKLTSENLLILFKAVKKDNGDRVRLDRFSLYIGQGTSAMEK